MRGLVFPLIVSALLCEAALGNPPPYTIADILSAPLPSELAATPRGDAFAWVMNAEGIRNIWMARAPAFVPTRITSFSADDGQSLGELAWVPDGSALLFTRGGSANGKGEIPNPVNSAERVSQDIWIATASGTARTLGDGHGAAVSPDGKFAVWIREGQIWSAELRGSRTPVQLTHVRGSASSLVWSSDSTRVAFVSDRNDHSFIGVYSFSGKSVDFIDAGADLDQSPVWSPDGTEVAFIRVPGSMYAFAWGPKRTGEPWSIRVANAITGKGREVWRAHRGMGSVFWPLTGSSELLWNAEGRIVFPWEGDGWLHLYSIPASATSPAGSPTLLTPGNFEVENAALSADANSVLFSSNQNDIDRRHLWSAGVGGGPVTQITKGSGIEARPVPLAAGNAGFVRSEAKAPPRIALLENGVMRDLTADQIPARFPSADSLVVPKPVEFTAADGIRIHAQLFLPANAASGRHPAVVFFHGGSRRQMLLGWHFMSYYSQAFAFNQYLASKGYVVLSVNYRSGTGYGERFREALNYGATGGSEYADVLAAGIYLSGRADVDTARIGLWGGSYGGYLTAMGLAKASNLFAAGVDLHGVHDWNLEITNYVPAYEPDKRQSVSTTAFWSSPMAFISTWKSPVLLIHGDDDRNVVFSQTVLLEEKLRKHGVHFEELIFPDEVHEFLVHDHWLKAYSAAADFLERYLNPVK
jgi:dipeptidyl aminopeptidase/acylaminoacyl peptidase